MAPVGHHGRVNSSLADYALAAPLNALGAHGFGPLGGPKGRPAARLTDLRATRHGVVSAIETAGLTGHRLLLVLCSLGGSASAEQLAFQTASAEPGIVKAGIERLRAADLVVVGTHGGVELTPAVRQILGQSTISLADPNLVTADELTAICRANGIQAMSNRKQDRIDAVARTFADRDEATRIRSELSPAARALLHTIAQEAGPGPTTSMAVGLPPYLVRLMPSLRHGSRRTPADAQTAPLEELHSRGLVGIAPWDDQLWIWREAWPLVDRAFIVDWSMRPDPRIVAARDPGGRLPPIVSALDQALRAWEVTPPTVLKNDEARLGKGDVKAMARSLGVDEVTLDVASRLAISIGLLLPNVVGRSGRGRTARVEEVWRGDPPLAQAWAALTPRQRWTRLVAEWCSAPSTAGHQLLANRHLVLWELAQVEEGSGYADVDHFAEWLGERYASLGNADAARECIRDLAALGVVTTQPLALTALGRRVIEDPAAVAVDSAPAATTAVVQADLTVIAPPDLHHDLVAAIEGIAELESSGSASIYRLSQTRITRAVQGGRTADEIIETLAGLSTAPLPDPVTRLVSDAAAKAGAVRLVSAATVVVVGDPADLVTACAIKALKLTKVTDTVAITDVPLAKVRTALERKRLAPEMIVAGAATKPPRSSAAEAASAAERAAALRSAMNVHARVQPYYEREAQQMEDRAKKLSDVEARLAVKGPLTLTRAAIDRLQSGRGK